jgi:hypothetical protein
MRIVRHNAGRISIVKSGDRPCIFTWYDIPNL